MKKSKKTVIITLCVVGVLSAAFVLGNLSFRIFKNKLENNIFPLKDPISVINSEYERNYGVIIDWIYNPNDLRQLAGAADYVFVARVTEVLGTGYTEVEMYDGFRFDSHPFTQYKIRVLKNLKGELKTDEDIPLTKHDGVYYLGKKVSFLEGDSLPDVGECYIFLCLSDEDGELTVSQFAGHNDVYLCKAEDYTGEEALIETYGDAVKNMDDSIRLGERYKSKYDVKLFQEK